MTNIAYDKSFNYHGITVDLDIFQNAQFYPSESEVFFSKMRLLTVPPVLIFIHNQATKYTMNHRIMG